MQKYKKIFIFIIAGIICVIVGIYYFAQKNDSTVSVSGDSPLFEEETAVTESCFLCVHVCGYVKNPGVYEIEDGKRINDAINAAGGCLPEAVINGLNLAQKISDGERIYVPGPESENQVKTGTDNGLINLNTADVNALMSLPGIGQSRAESIIEFRNSNGKFKTIEDIMKVAGIKNAAFEKIKEYICV